MTARPHSRIRHSWIRFLFARFGDLAIAFIRLVRALRSGESWRDTAVACSEPLKKFRASIQARLRLTAIRFHRFHARAKPRQVLKMYLAVLVGLSLLLCLVLLLSQPGRPAQLPAETNSPQKGKDPSARPSPAPTPAGLEPLKLKLPGT